jgi:hypothetical protein
MREEFPPNKSYDARAISNLPEEADRILYYPGALESGGTDGMIVSIEPRSAPAWLGVFSFGMGGLSGLFGWPDGAKLCVISRGFGYLVAIDQPTDWEEIDLVSIEHAILQREGRWIALADRTRLVGSGQEGRSWRTPRLSWDGIKNLKESDDSLEGLAWDAPSERWVRFEVDPLTGDHQGGAAP